MEDFARAGVDGHPFPHVLVDDYLEPTLYDSLARSFPECSPNSGPTGYTCFWGDADYDALIGSDKAWAGLFRRFHSQAFIDHVVAQFAETFDAEGAVDLRNARYVPYQETRGEKELTTLRPGQHAPDDLWVRVDIMQGRIGYERRPHLDHRRRAVSMLLYLSDAAESQMVGGELVLNAPDGAPVSVITPRHNRMVMFPCTETSFHSVPRIRSQVGSRNFVQVTVSSFVDLWRPSPAGLLKRLANRGRSALGGASRAFR